MPPAKCSPSLRPNAAQTGGQLDTVRDRFGSCEVVTTLDNGLGVATAEQGDPVAVCRDPRVPWDRLWAELRHLG